MPAASPRFRPFIVAPLLAALLPPAAAGAEDLQARALVEARQQAVLSSEIAGRIVALPLEPGETVAAGDLLVGFDCARHEAERDSARAEVKAAEATLRRTRRLDQLGSVGAAEVELADVAVDAARASLRRVEVDVAHCAVRAPFAGRVVDRPVRRHESVAAGTPLIEVLSDADLKLALIAPSAWLAWLRPGLEFTVAIDETGRTLRAAVERVNARVDPVSQSVNVSARLLDAPLGALVAGMSGTARFDPPAALSAAPP